MANTHKVAFLGLGVMGGPMAGHLARAGHDVAVYNRSPAKTETWLKNNKGRGSATAADAAKGADFVFACVGNDADLATVTTGATGAYGTMPKNAIFIDHTTTSVTAAVQAADAARAKGLHFLDAPVSGGQAGAENGQLTVMVGGDSEPFERARPVIAHFAKAVTLMGPSGAGQKTKIVNQVCIAGLVQGLSEGLAFALAAGLDANLVIDVISKGAAQSWQMENRGRTMVEGKFNFGFAVDWMRKDLGIALDEARKNGSQLPVAALVDQFYAKLQKQGDGRCDTSSLIKLLNDR
jgi:3-hydroxyisobutyrate dehydrogenase-like beta-hydroxyacid dehydrogenase